MKILGIETSCDETAAAVVEDGRRILSSVVSTQIKIHKPYSGVVPELASRSHVVALNRVIQEASKNPKAVDAIAVTVGPGLVGSLLVGKMTAEALGWVFQKPVYGINHIEGHLLSPLLDTPHLSPPFLGLIVSGGHTELIYAKTWGDYRLIGRTRDDAAGEAFDKAAKMMNLGYPGGPIIDQMAKQGDPLTFPFPRPWLPGTWDFSFSGLKTAMLYKLKEKEKWTLKECRDLCAGFQDAVVQVLVGKTMAAAKAFGARKLVVGGGVAANSQLRANFLRASKKERFHLFMAPPALCTDNAAMIASAAYFKIVYKHASKNHLKIKPQMHLPFMRGPLPSFSVSH